MARESELYRDTLERVRKLNEQKFGGVLVLTQKQAAELIGVSARTLSRKGLKEDITCEKIARAFS